MTTWPTGLPQYVELNGFQLTPQDQAIRTAMASGPKKARRRFTAAVKDSPYFIRCTAAQWDALWDFYDTTLGVVEQFDWVDHKTGATATYRFTAPPKITAALGPDQYRVALPLEIMP